MSKLSLLIPARNEEFLTETVEDILRNIRGDTDIIVVLDGEWAIEPLPQHERLTVIYLPESVGQRAATNIAAKISNADYLMKVDAHCAFDEGFDVSMLECFAALGDDITAVPVMRNLHVFDWVCSNGHRDYQRPSGPCEKCGEPVWKEIVWNPKESPQSTSYSFDKTLKFQYFNGYKDNQYGDYVESMSLQGSCFMVSRAKYWELDICDENAGSWGHQGSELALKTWLSGGRVIVNKKTWYAHLFRTKGGDFGFPWPAKESEIEKTRQYFRDIFLEDRWPKATRKLQWLIDKFDPPEWRSNE